MYIDQSVLQPYIAQGLITERCHPHAEHLRIYNYTTACQYAQAWDAVTMQCRGLIQDVEREAIVARPFGKFFNYEEHIAQGRSIPTEIPIVTEKFDGALGILYWLQGEPWIATRGSFTSPHAEWATTWLRSTMAFLSQEGWNLLRNPDVTHLFEILAPVSALVVTYDCEGLAHLATIDTATGRDVWPLPLLPYLRYPRVLALGDADLAEIQRRNAANEEGYVALFPTSGLRLKAKFAWYVERHRIITGLSAHTLWEMWRDGQSLEDVLRGVPEELYAWITQQYGRFVDGMTALDGEVTHTYAHVMHEQLSRSWGKNKTARDKEIALHFQQYDHAGLLFQWHKWREMLWKAVEPSGSETFRQDADA